MAILGKKGYFPVTTHDYFKETDTKELRRMYMQTEQSFNKVMSIAGRDTSLLVYALAAEEQLKDLLPPESILLTCVRLAANITLKEMLGQEIFEREEVEV